MDPKTEQPAVPAVDPEPGKGGASRFLVREWPYLLLVLISLLLIAGALLPRAPEETAADAVGGEAIGEPSPAEIMARLDERPALKRMILGVAGGAVLLFFCGIPLLGYLLWRHAEGDPLLGPKKERSTPGWGLWDVVKSAAVYVVFLQAAGGLAVWLVPGWADSGSSSLTLILAANLLITIFVFRLAAGRATGSAPDRFGLHGGRFWRRAGEGVVGYTAFFPILVGLALITLLMTTVMDFEPEQNPIVPMVLEADSAWFMLFIFVFGGLIGPVTEEIFFRGFFYPPLRYRVGPVGAILVSAACFSALHGNLVQFLPIFGLGLILAVLRERTGSLIPCITLHCMHNLAVLSLLYMLKPVIV